MIRLAKKTILSSIRYLGYELHKTTRESSAPISIPPPAEIHYPVEFSKEEIELTKYIFENNLTMVSMERLWGTLMACKHVIDRGIDGDFVECGVWRGGNALLATQMFRLYGVKKRVWLFDTFEGMTEPSDVDTRTHDGFAAKVKFAETQRDTHNEWCFCSIDDVKQSFREAGVLDEDVYFVKGDVMKTLEDQNNLPEKISILRLDTDWYESTKKELEVLYPKISLGGVVILDDYGHWSGSRIAADEYFEKNNNRPFLQYSDAGGRAGVKFD